MRCGIKQMPCFPEQVQRESAPGTGPAFFLAVHLSPGPPATEGVFVENEEQVARSRRAN